MIKKIVLAFIQSARHSFPIFMKTEFPR